ncbi:MULTISPECIES: AAA family ATPase [Kamptonema]|uniref:AAA family ATPase n=1 Tax=Kamptonema TaxID=1501433 RepID=UPI0001DACFBB|nr:MULTISPECIES: AAA family ATPase [Kamptonema]CBN59314.1 ATP binding protein [Kamptonema sp. PCC 6506]
MKVKRLKINAFRGIDNLNLEFNPDEPIVIIGNNGVGKSSILDCIAILLSRFLYLIQFPNKNDSLNPSFFRVLDIKNGYKEIRNQIIIELSQSQEISWSVTKEDSGNEKLEGMEKLKEVAQNIHNQWKGSPLANIPLAVYYPTNRGVIERHLESQNGYSFKQTDAYNQALEQIQISFDSFFQWFADLEDLENEQIRDNHEHRNRNLETVRQSIYSLIPNFSNLRVRRSILRMTVKKQGQELIVNQLSDGEKCLLAMVGDLARRLAIANPGLENPLEGSAVVLIDEIELHLHPKWQREIIPALTRTFPNCQFIITTHSPQVISQIKPDGIYILEATPEGIVAKQPESSFGRDSNRILEDVMGVPERPQEIKDSLRQLFRLIDAGNLDAAKELRQQIEDEIGEDESEFVRADILMRRKEILNR